jgi:hypothetical protein
MAWFEDLAECTYFHPLRVSALRAVGWLECGRPFSLGAVDPRVYSKLKELSADPWQPFVFAGHHSCDLCTYEPGASGSGNVFVPGDTVIYVCPELVVHYMNAHGYQPPAVFCSAVLACPEMRSMAYLRAILKNGGRELVQEARGLTTRCS